MKKSLVNGIASEYLSIYDRATHYGDGIFETILCHGKQLYYWQAHYQRLFLSAKKLKLHCPAEDVLLTDIRKLLEQNPSDENDNSFSIKIIVTRGEGERGYLFPDNVVSNHIVLISELDASYSSILSEQLLSGSLFLCAQQVSINRQLAGLKHLNRLENVIARNEWVASSKGNDILDGLMLNENQHVIEGCMSNLFAVKNNELFTPDLSLSGINGIMRQVIIDLADKLNIKLTIMNLGKDDILVMDGLFISNSLIGIKSITCLKEITFDQQAITKQLFAQLINTINNHAHSVY